MPLEIYVFLGALIEEIIPPIPSPLIVLTAGTLAGGMHMAHLYIFWLAVWGALGKVIGASALYVIADKAEDIIIGRFGKFVGVTHKEIEKLGSRFKGGWQDDALLFALRATPIIPSSVVSVMAGAIKLNWRTYLLQTFLGTIVRNLFFLYMGMVGYSFYERIEPYLDSAEKVVLVLAAIGFIGIAAYFILKKYKDQIAERFINNSKK